MRIENSNGLLSQRVPKETDFRAVSTACSMGGKAVECAAREMSWLSSSLKQSSEGKFRLCRRSGAFQG